ncbi:MAG: aminoglycoside phosphotransferase family protein [Chitinophagaceae bacterium]|nr:aminoglycoside phosphotransferase family protein [Chitinophagaceae bacterium]
MTVDIEDIDSLRNYLVDLKQISPGEDCTLQILKGGVSNKTVWVTRPGGEQWVIKQALSKLRVKEDWYCVQDRIEVEYEGLKWLSEILPEGSVPEPVFFDKKDYVLCMSAVPRPHENLKSLLLHGLVEYRVFEKLGIMLGRIHMSGKEDLRAQSIFDNRRFFEDLRIEPFYEFTAQQLPESRSFYDRLMDETLNIRTTIVHGDYSPKNILVKDEKVILLDYEVMHRGDPAFDIGFFLCQVLSFANHLQGCREKLINAAAVFWENYVETISGADILSEQLAVKHTLGCLLARVKGRSPVDFLNREEQHRQVTISLYGMKQAVTRVPDLLQEFNRQYIVY